MFDTMSVDKKSSLLCYENIEFPNYYRENQDFDNKSADKPVEFNPSELYKTPSPFLFHTFNTLPVSNPELLANPVNHNFLFKPVTFPSETSETELARCLGVRFDSSNSAWVARWVEPHSEKKKSRWFSVAKYGEAAARRLAIQACLQNMRQSDLPGLRDLQDLIANFTFSAFPPPAQPGGGPVTAPPHTPSDFFTPPTVNSSNPPPTPFFFTPDQLHNNAAAAAATTSTTDNESPDSYESTTDSHKLSAYNPVFPMAANYMAALSMLPQVIIPPNELVYLGLPQRQAVMSTEPSSNSSNILMPNTTITDVNNNSIINSNMPKDQQQNSESPESSKCIYTYPNNDNTAVEPHPDFMHEHANTSSVIEEPSNDSSFICNNDSNYEIYNSNVMKKSSTDMNENITTSTYENASPRSPNCNIYESENNSDDNGSDHEDGPCKKRKLNEPNSQTIESYMNNFQDGVMSPYFTFQNSLVSPSPHNFLPPPFNSYQLDLASSGFYFSPFYQQHQLANLSLAGLSTQPPLSAKMTCERGLHYSKAYRGNQECWIAVWNTKGGRIMHEAFQVAVMGYEQAKMKAREARDSAHSNNISINENSRPSWKSHSNTGIPHVSLDSQQLRFRAHKYGRRLCRSFSFGKRRGSFATKETAFDAAVLWLIQTPTEEEIASTSGGISSKNEDPLL